MYADDIVLITTGNTYAESERKLALDVEATNQWCLKNCLTVNKKKTKVMRITRNRITGVIPALNISIGDNVLEDVQTYRYLGITVDSRFTFKPHVNNLLRTVSHKVTLLGRIKKYLDENESLLIYKQTVVPYCDYASFTTECTVEDLVTKLQRLQNRALRICRFGYMFERSSATALHEHFKIQELKHRRYTQLLLMMYKQSKTKGLLVPEGRRRTRGDHKIKFDTRVNTYASTDRSPMTRGVKAWNLLLASTQKLATSAAFKCKIRGIKPPAKR